LEDKGVVGRIILNFILKNKLGGRGLYSSGLGYGQVESTVNTVVKL
jgi:hypothetical protein